MSINLHKVYRPHDRRARLPLQLISNAIGTVVAKGCPRLGSGSFGPTLSVLPSLFSVLPTQVGTELERLGNEASVPRSYPGCLSTGVHTVPWGLQTEDPRGPWDPHFQPHPTLPRS